MTHLSSDWRKAIRKHLPATALRGIQRQVRAERARTTVFPQRGVLRALNETPLDQVRVVIVGQDCYHGVGHDGKPLATGLAFCVEPPHGNPPSLTNIYREMANTLPSFGSLQQTTQQGVLLLNAALTVVAGKPGSHLELWRPFTSAVLQTVGDQERPIVWMLWGKFAQNLYTDFKLRNHDHLVLRAAHPSPLAAGAANRFLGCNHFVLANNFLVKCGYAAIRW